MYRLICFVTAALLIAIPTGMPAGAPHAPLPSPQLQGSIEPAAGRFLVASRALQDPHFARTVVYILQHDAQGSLGLVINRTLETTLGKVLPGESFNSLASHRLAYGGPVSARHIIMLLRSEQPPGHAIPVVEGIYASNNMDLLRKLDAADTPASELRLFAGHAGWGAGQLEGELRRDDWFVVPGDIGMVFDRDRTRLWDRLIEQLDPSGVYVHDRSGRRYHAGL
jgi:putative transcriptional regulator